MITYPDWSSPKKAKARNETIVDMYRSIFGQTSIPAEKQYWTMCGQNGDGSGNARPGCEFGHMVTSGLITPRQFYGVEKDADIHRINQKVSSEAHWMNNDFYRAMIEQDNAGNFNPAIINIDHVKMPKSGGVRYIAQILYFADQVSNNVMVVGNLILKCYSHKAEYTDLPDLLYKERCFQAVKPRWSIHGHAYVYQGSSDGRTTEMGSIILWKKT